MVLLCGCYFQNQNCPLDVGMATLQCPIVCNPSDATCTCKLYCDVDLAELGSCGLDVERWSGRSTYDPIIVSVENTRLAMQLQTTVCVKMAEEDGDSAQSGCRQLSRRGSLMSSPSKWFRLLFLRLLTLPGSTPLRRFAMLSGMNAEIQCRPKIGWSVTLAHAGSDTHCLCRNQLS